MGRQLRHHANFVKSFVHGETTTSRPMRLAIGIGQIIDQNVCASLKLDTYSDNPYARRLVRETRTELRDLFADFGAVASQ